MSIIVLGKSTTQESSKRMELTDATWNKLEVAARNAAAAGGFAAMGYYRDALDETVLLGEGHNPATEADMQATLAILRTLDPAIRFITGTQFGRSYFAEELADQEGNPKRKARIDEIILQVGGTSNYICRTSEAFAKSFPHSICILFDGLDGTTNFRAGIPLFCSAVAFFIEQEPRVGAIYDPIHNVVYYGSLRGRGITPHSTGHAYMWNVQSGSKAPLPIRTLSDASETKLLGLHITRSNPRQRQRALEYLGNLTDTFRGTYMLNSGQLSLAYVASGNITAFVNNYTNIWDVAAGEVLVRAIGGRVTDFKGASINYRSAASRKDKKVAVAASMNTTVHEELLDCLHRR
jgi:fructose-1,6-bisphosphatase/inositol monophosphatase family enzyme